MTTHASGHICCLYMTKNRMLGLYLTSEKGYCQEKQVSMTSLAIWYKQMILIRLISFIWRGCGWGHQWLCLWLTSGRSGPWFNIKMPYYQYRKSHCGDKMVVRSSYLRNGNSFSMLVRWQHYIEPILEPILWMQFENCDFQFCFTDWYL